VLYADDEEVPLIQEFLYYKSMEGDNTKDYKRSSGAYIFRPDGAPVPVCDNQKKPERISGITTFAVARVIRILIVGGVATCAIICILKYLTTYVVLGVSANAADKNGAKHSSAIKL